MNDAVEPVVLVCPQCSTQVAPRLLSCPACGWLKYGSELKNLAAEAEFCQQRNDLRGALVAWRRALELLPARSRQAETIAEKVEGLSRELEERGLSEPDEKRPAWLKTGGVLAAVGLMLWKLKAVVPFVLTKGKALLLGFTKSGTLFSMLLSAGIYWTVFGWKFAFGLVLSIYVHEIGHVVALQRMGIRASAPMFIPGIGAVIRAKQYPVGPREDARVGLAGPVWGLGAAVAALGLHWITGWASLAAIAKFGAWINLFNLLPVWQLDGGRGFRALGRLERWVVTLTMAAMWWLTGEGLLVLLALAGGAAALLGKPPEASDRRALIEYAFLVITLSLLCTLTVPGTQG